MTNEANLSQRSDDEGEGEQSSLMDRLKSFFGRNGDEGDMSDGLDDGQRDAVARMPRGRREMIERVIAFDAKRVVDVMAPRADIVAVDVATTLDELVKVFAEAGHSRLPVYRVDLDDPIGMVHIKDVVHRLANPSDEAAGDGPILKKIRRDVLYVPPSMRITDLLLKMQASRIHMALVVDEFGGTDGLVTIEDLVEEVVGDINDEHDDEEAPTIVPRAGGGWEVDARVELGAFTEATGVVMNSEDDEVDTLGGLAFSLAGRVPQRGEVLSHPDGFDFEVTEADVRKVRKILIRRRSSIAPNPDAAEVAE